MKALNFNIWLLSYGACSLVAGAFLGLLALRLTGGVAGILGFFAAYLMLSGVLICAHSRYSPGLFLGSGLVLLVWSMYGIFTAGLGRTQLFGLLGSLITVHGFWVLQQELAKWNKRSNREA